MLSCFWTRVRAVVHRRGDRGREGTAPRRVYFHRRIEEEEEDKEEDRWWIEGKDDRVGFACRGATTKAAPFGGRDFPSGWASRSAVWTGAHHGAVNRSGSDCSPSMRAKCEEAGGHRCLRGLERRSGRRARFEMA